MSSYLEEYGASEALRARRIRILKISSILLVCALIGGGILYALVKNRGEEQEAKRFVSLLADHNYSAAYRMWGCTDTKPCANYPIGKFLDDWGPQSPHADESSADIGLSQSCGSGVVLRLDYKAPEQPVTLWVERNSRIISFAPYPECPGRHLHVGAWLRSIFK